MLAPTVSLHPRIPDDELAARPALLGRALADAGFDGWLAFGDDRAVAGPDHVRYLADFEPHFEPVLLAGRATDARALMLTGPESVGYATVVTARAAVEEIVAIEEFAHPDEEYPTIEISSGAERLRELFADARRIAVLGATSVPAALWRRAIEPLREDGRELEAGDEVAYTLRAVKTAAEQAVIDEAYRIARLGLEAAARTLRPGVSERQVAAAAESVMREAGAEGFGIDTMVASGVANTAPILARSTFRTIAAEDLVTVTLAPRYEGYHAALARAFLFAPNTRLEAAIEVARLGQRAALELLVAGREGREAVGALRDTLERGQTGATMPYVPLHSVGLIEFEPPIFMTSSATTIRAGMALSIDSPLFHGPWGGLRLEDGFSIDAAGAARPRFDDYEAIVPVLL
jgi:Xaa-Pro aminopeptidase